MNICPVYINYTETWSHKAEQADFTSAMADAASSIVEYFRGKGGIAFINVMSNISIRCDCGTGAPEPKIRDLGILASIDPVAIDRASFDLITIFSLFPSQVFIFEERGQK